METLEAIARRIAVTEDLGSVVHTMKALSMASIRQFEQAADAINDYYRTVEMGLHRVLRDAARGGHRRRARARRRIGAVIVGSDQGLCGRFNDDVTRHALLALRVSDVPGPDRRLLAVGARVAARLENAQVAVDETMPAPASVAALTASTEQVLLVIEHWRSRGAVEEVMLYYNRAGGGTYRPHSYALLPVDPGRFETLRSEAWPTRALPLYTMEHEALLAALLRQYFFVTVFRALAESAAAEQAARLAAMHGASRNIDERLVELRAVFQHRRQEAITEEILDIVNGFEATARA